MKPLPDPPPGFRYYRDKKTVLRAPELFAYQHLMLKAWDEMKLTGMLTLNGTPTVLISDSRKPLPPKEVAERHLTFWNQGLATILLLRDPHFVRVFSSMTKPLSSADVDAESIEETMVEAIDLATQAVWAECFYLQLGNGHYYSKPENRAKFDPKQTVDAYLLNNLEAVRDELVAGKDGLAPATAHAFLGRILFACYLCHRGIVRLENYLKGTPAIDILTLLSAFPEQAHRLLYDKLFPALKKEFNSSMFDDDLRTERAEIKKHHLLAIRHFLEGSEIRSGQRTLGFTAYNFAFIPVETISSIYEKFLDHEDETGKRILGAYYTPRLLAEMTIDLALRDSRDLGELHYLDPSCGSGIFLVLMFNRLAAEWRASLRKPASIPDQAEALLARMARLAGVDKNLTACRITCFSLYLAFLNQFEPADIRNYFAQTGEQLPNLLTADGFKKPSVPVVWHRDFLETRTDWHGKFDIVVGNPPWVGRGSKQLVNRFMTEVPCYMKSSGTACLILPTKVFLNKTDAFQKQWLAQVTLETVVQMADFSFILFKEALCPATLVRFRAKKPPEEHEVEYITPKVTRADLRDGLISVSPQDRKWIPLAWLNAAADQKVISVAWKTRLWGTPRDQKLLNYLFTLPKLEEITQQLRGRIPSRPSKRWQVGQGCKPWKENSTTKLDRALKDFGEWGEEDAFARPDDIDFLPFVAQSALPTLAEHFHGKNYQMGKLYSKPPESLFTPPVVLLNQGFSSAAYFDYKVRFQHSLQSFSCDDADAPSLRFLTVFLNSKLARYFVFHTASNIGTERDKVHTDQVLRLPFFLPDNPAASKDAPNLVGMISKRFEQHMKAAKQSAAKLAQQIAKAKVSMGPLFDEDGHQNIEELRKGWLFQQRAEADNLRTELEPIIYQYFGLTEQDIVLVEDTCDIFDRSDTPGSIEGAADIPTLQPIHAPEQLRAYADIACTVLNQRISGSVRVISSGTVDSANGLALVELSQSKIDRAFKPLRNAGKLLESAARLQEASVERVGDSFEFHRAGWYFEGRKIFIVKPARQGEWTRTAALNDAADLHQHITSARVAQR